MALAGRSNLAMPEDPSNSVSEPEEGRPDEDSEVEIAELLRRADLWAANGLAGLLGERLRSRARSTDSPKKNSPNWRG